MCFQVDNSLEKPFGGKVVILGGDFKQILHVVPNASRVEIVLATINSSRFLKYCKILKLSQNMCLQCGSNYIDQNENQSFSEWILALGDDNVGD